MTISNEELIFLIDKYMDKYDIKKDEARKMVEQKYVVTITK